MQFFQKQRLFVFGLVLFLSTLLVAKFLSPLYLKAVGGTDTAPAKQSVSPGASSGGLGGEIDAFFQAGARGYLVWQFSGQQISPFETDQYSFFKGDPVCAVLKTKAAQYPDKFIGVNIHSAPKNPGLLSADMLTYLAKDCGTTVIRVFATDVTGGVSGAQGVLNQVNVYNNSGAGPKIRVIVAAADFNVLYPTISSNLDGWFSGGYTGGYKTYATKLAQAIGKDPALFGIELMNEPHCTGQASCFKAYSSWSKAMAGALKGYVSSDLGIGQMAHQDLPYFVESNNSQNITMASGHYYTPEEREKVMEALTKLKGSSDKAFFYVGEAPPKVSSKTKTYYEFNIQRETTQKVLSNFYDEYSVACLPVEEYNVGFENTEKCGKPGVYCPADWQKNWNIPGKIQFTADGKGYGLFRDEKSVNQRASTGIAPKRNESIEAYLSQVNPLAPSSVATPRSPKSQPIKSNQTPLHQMTTLEQQCNFVVNKLKAVHELCLPENRIDQYTKAGEVSPQDDGEACGLNTPVSGTSIPYDQEAMLIAFQNKHMSCQQLVDSQNSEDKKFVLDLLKVNISLETAYRPAFVVAVTTFTGPADKANVTTTSKDESGKAVTETSKYQVIDYLEVKIPASATDFLPTTAKASSSLINDNRNSYRDPVQITADVLRTKESQDQTIQEEIKDRELLKTQGDKVPGTIIGNNGSTPIFCNVGGKLVKDCMLPTGVGAAYQDQIPQALVTFINASGKLDPRGKWDTLPCSAREVDMYPQNNKEHIAEQAQRILATLETQKIGPYEKQNKIATNISVNVKDKTQGTFLDTRTELYFVTPQRYELQYAENSFKAYVELQAQNNLDLAHITELKKVTSDSLMFSPLLKSELNKKLTGRDQKAYVDGTQQQLALTPPATTGSVKPVTAPLNTGYLVGLLTDLSEKKDTQSMLWKVAGQVASLPTRMMTLISTPIENAMHQYTLSCTGDFATENWLSGKCMRADKAVQSSSSTSDMCIETKITNSTTLQSYASKLMSELPSQADLWSRYYKGYFPGKTQFLFSTNSALCNPSGPCYEKIISEAVANNINPYLAIGIALNETGGFKSLNNDGIGPHFGCGVSLNPNESTIGSGTILNKLSCMVGAFNNYSNQGMSDDAAMRKYGYANGQKNHNLSTIIGILSSNTYKGSCK